MSEPCEVMFKLVRCRSSVPRARAVLRAKLGEWRAGHMVAESGELVLSELVTNALRVQVPGDRMVGVRIESREREGLLRLEVSDAGEGRPVVRQPGELDTAGRGLLLVQALAHRWGVDERQAGIGKTVWADLLAPGAAPVLGEADVAAVTLRPGQSVRVWGAWRTVRSVRSERYASGGLFVIVCLDEGPALRLQAGEGVTVRTGGASAAGTPRTPAGQARPLSGPVSSS
ncbi:ATP-binding protein [Streptomyces sp. NBC_01260]|uniref:ATP-binding protein n=1 Tax=unclassified Streptomyces TaxID=2593676 RepID=UPI002E2F0D9D|nr:ATP-binding protein [Streptomyces sp. NBC_01260]